MPLIHPTVRLKLCSLFADSYDVEVLSDTNINWVPTSLVPMRLLRIRFRRKAEYYSEGCIHFFAQPTGTESKQIDLTTDTS